MTNKKILTEDLFFSVDFIEDFFYFTLLESSIPVKIHIQIYMATLASILVTQHQLTARQVILFCLCFDFSFITGRAKQTGTFRKFPFPSTNLATTKCSRTEIEHQQTWHLAKIKWSIKIIPQHMTVLTLLLSGSVNYSNQLSGSVWNEAKDKWPTLKLE